MSAAATGRPLVVVTGASGLLGMRIASDLQRDHRVVGLDVKQPADADALEWIECDLTDADGIAAAMERVESAHGSQVASVFHLAGHCDFSGAPSPLYEQLTVRGTWRLLRELRRFQVEQFVFSSSLLVMRPTHDGARLTEDSPTQAEWDYPRSMLAAEAVIRQECGEIPAVVLRIASVYDEDCHSIPIAQQIARIREKRFESCFFPGDAHHAQSFVHLDDAVASFRAVLQMRERLGEHECFLVGEEDLMSYAELQDALGGLLHGREWPTLRIPGSLAKAGSSSESKTRKDELAQPWMIDLAGAHLPISIERARLRLGWEPRHRLRDTLPEMVRRLEADPVRWYPAQGLPVPEATQT